MHIYMYTDTHCIIDHAENMYKHICTQSHTCMHSPTQRMHEYKHTRKHNCKDAEGKDTPACTNGTNVISA